MARWFHHLGHYRWLAVAWLLVLVFSPLSIATIDTPLAESMRGLDPSVRSAAAHVTELGKAQWWLVPAACLLVWGVCRRSWLFANRVSLVFLAVAGAGLSVHVFKFFFGRCRPKLFFNDGQYGFQWFQHGYDYSSFPSGHSTVAGAAAVSIWLTAPGWLRWPIVVLSVLVASSRVVVTSHWAADIFAGYLLGASFASLLHWRYRQRGWLAEPHGFMFIRGRRSVGRDVAGKSLPVGSGA